MYFFHQHQYIILLPQTYDDFLGPLYLLPCILLIQDFLFINGQFTLFAFSLVSFISLNLSTFAPVFTPHQSVAYASFHLLN